MSDVESAVLCAGHIPAITWISTTEALHPPTSNGVTKAPATSGRTVFVFPHHGRHSTDHAVEMMGCATTFAEHMRCCDTAFADLGGWSVLDAIYGITGARHVDGADMADSVLFSITTSLARQWQALGLHPQAVLGHSTGEIAAAYIAGALPLSEAAKVLTQRCTAARAMSTLERADVTAVGATPDTTAPSSPIETCARNLRDALSGLQTRTADAAFISTVTGAWLDTTILDAEYWSANFRQPVLFTHAVRWASDHGYRTFIEVNPHPELTADVLESLRGCTDDR